jgi:pimeloyl-ACP methyl ester carboxylesterase
MMRARAAAVCLPVCVLAAGCGGGGTNEPSTHTAASAPRAAQSGPLRVDIGGRTLRGECVGKRAAGHPTVVLAAGQGSDEHQLDALAKALSKSHLVCGYARAGVADSDPFDHSPATLSDEVQDMRAVITRGQLPRPYVIVGQSLGAQLALMYAQRHPDGVAGVVAMNPGPTYHDWLRRLRPLVSRSQLRENEIKPLSGIGQDEAVDTRQSDQLLRRPFPRGVPYAVMYAEDCGGGTDAYCNKVVKQLESAHRALARLSPNGRFVAVPGAGHEIYTTDLEKVLATVAAVEKRAGG